MPLSLVSLLLPHLQIDFDRWQVTFVDRVQEDIPILPAATVDRDEHHLEVFGHPEDVPLPPDVRVGDVVHDVCVVTGLPPQKPKGLIQLLVLAE